MPSTTEKSELFDMANKIIDELAENSFDDSDSHANWLRVVEYGKLNGDGKVNPYEVASKFLGSLSDTVFRDNPTVGLTTMVEFIDRYKRTQGPGTTLSDTLRVASGRLNPINNFTEFTALVFALVFTEVIKEMFSEPATTTA
jgi:hypothetical protein